MKVQNAAPAATVNLRQVTEESTAAQALASMLTPRPASSITRRAQQYADAGQSADRIFAILSQICQECHVTLSKPRWKPGGTDQDIFTWCTKLCDQMHSDKIGRVRVEGNRAIYSWYEVRKESGILNHKFTRERSTHMIENVKWRKLPVSFDVPPKAARILSLIESNDELTRACRVVEGFLIGQQTSETKWNEPTAISRAAIGLKDFIAGNAKVLAIGALGTAAAIASGIVETAGSMIATAAADPAIVLGDIVFFGWKE